MVQTAMDRRIPIALVAEQEPSRGGCPFAQLLQQTPRVLQQPPYKLYDTLAVPLFPSMEHRRVSLRHILRSMGAVPCDARALTRCLHLCRRRIGRLLEVPTPGKARPTIERSYPQLPLIRLPRPLRVARDSHALEAVDGF
uniref:Uncharacterized protein n=1 Tax=Emiliania huxleyi TaxID=2903 RepID=A0A7S3X392_EMIHU